MKEVPHCWGDAWQDKAREKQTMKQNDGEDNFSLWPRGRKALDEVSCC